MLIHAWGGGMDRRIEERKREEKGGGEMTPRGGV